MPLLLNAHTPQESYTVLSQEALGSHQARVNTTHLPAGYSPWDQNIRGNVLRDMAAS